jgi:hypothetical protein
MTPGGKTIPACRRCRCEPRLTRSSCSDRGLACWGRSPWSVSGKPDYQSIIRHEGKGASVRSSARRKARIGATVNFLVIAVA